VALKLHKYQTKVFNSTARFIGAISGIRGGKTTVGAAWLCERIYQDWKDGKRGDYLIVAPTNNVLSQATLPKFKEFFPKDWGVWKEQPKSYFQLNWNRKTPDGKETNEPCRIFVRSMDDPNAIEGMEAHAIWADEVGFMKNAAWLALRGRTSITQAPILMTSTPYSMNWFFTEIYQRWKSGNKDYDVIQWGSGENPAFPAEELEAAKKELPKEMFERRYMGKFTRLEGLAYPEFDEDEHIVEPFAIPSKGLVFAGADFGYNNPNAIVYIWEEPEKKIYYVFKEFYKSKVLLKDVAYSIQKVGPSYVLADTQAAQNIAELRRFYGLHSIKPADKVKDIGIERIRTLLIEKRLKFFKTVTNTIEEIKAYHYAPPKMDGTSTEKLVDKDNHAMDALRYAFSRPLQGLYSNRVQKNYRSILAKRMERLAPHNPRTGW
jgi:phage terminase large subunit